MPSLRITGGTLRGRRVPVPAGEVRPTSERARQAYFNIVHERIAGARFLDLFAGSGIFSLEALSRGAGSAVAVEMSRKQCAVIEQTARDFGVAVTTIAGDAVAALPPAGAGDRLPAARARTARTRSHAPQEPVRSIPDSAPFDLVYADPPYGYEAYDELLAAIGRTPLAEDALVAVEHRRRTQPFQETQLREFRRAEYGEVWITFFQR